MNNTTNQSRRPITPEDYAEIHRLHAEGLSRSAIAKKSNLYLSSVSKVLAGKMKIDTRGKMRAERVALVTSLLTENPKNPNKVIGAALGVSKSRAIQIKKSIKLSGKYNVSK